MSEESAGLTDSIARLPQRVASLIELLTTLDQRIIGALESLEEMRTTVSTFDGVGPRGEALARDVEERIARFDERLNRDLDDIKAKLMTELDGLGELGPRFDRLEQAVLNIEQATVNLDRAFEGGLEMLPDFMSRRLKGEGKKKAPEATNETPPPGPQ